MTIAVIVFPGSNCDRDMAVAFERVAGVRPVMVWHKEADLPPGTDLVALPGGFSFGDYLRCGAIAARSPIMRAVADHVGRGGLALGVCNGWQILIEAGLLPGALLRNKDVTFLCQRALVRVEATDTVFTQGYAQGSVLSLPVAHHDGAFFADSDAMAALEDEERVAFRYVGATGRVSETSAPNGSLNAVAGVLSPNRRVLGMMPHPERAAEAALGGDDGAALFRSLVEARLAA